MLQQKAIKSNSLPRKIKSFFLKRTDEKISYILGFIYFSLMAFAYLIPIYFCITASIKTATEFYESSLLTLPAKPQFDTWKNLLTLFKFGNFTFLTMLWNSIWYTVVSVTVSLVSSTMLAYALSKFEFPGKNLLYGIAIFKQIIPIFGSGAANYKLMMALGFINNPLGLWLSWATGFDFQFIVLYGVFNGISGSYAESAKIDGASNLTILIKIMFPLVIPTVVALAVTQGVTQWNGYEVQQIYMPKYPNLAYGLFVFPQEAKYVPNAKSVMYAATLLSVIPMITIYACFQKVILKNMSVGGLKG